MGSSLFMVVLPAPTDGRPPDWAAARQAIDQLAFTDLPDRLLDAVEGEVDDAAVDYQEAVLAAARVRLHRRITELEEAFGDGQEGRSRDRRWTLGFLHLFDRRMLVTGGLNSGEGPAELLDTLIELADTIPLVRALAGDDRPVPPTASTPALEAGQVLEIDGAGRYTLTADDTLVAAPATAPVHARAALGSVIYLQRDHHADGVSPLIGPGYFVIEQDYRNLKDQTPYPVLTALVQND